MFLKFEGIMNVRDLGGIPAVEDRRVKPGMLLRGAKLNTAGDADIARLQEEFHLRHIVDFRDENECRRKPDRMVPGAVYHNLPALPQESGKEPPTPETVPEPDFDGTFRRIYSQLAESERTAGAYREFFRILCACPDGAVFWHCTQGKDRTGAAALLLLAALGVDRETAMEGYYLSNEGLRPKLEQEASVGAAQWPREVRERLYYVYPEYVGIYLDTMDRLYGGLEGYLRVRLGLTDADFLTLREHYLE